MNAGATTITLDSVPTGSFDLNKSAYISIEEMEGAQMTNVARTPVDATHDKVTLTLKSGLASSYTQGTYVSQLQWVTYAVDNSIDGATGKPKNILTRDAHDVDSNGNLIGPQIVASNITGLTAVPSAADPRMITVTLTAATSGANPLTSSAMNSVRRRNN